VKEYPTSTAHVGHFRALLDELKMKKNFIPDIIYIDYINICASQRYKAGANYNSYFAIKAIAEELRGMAVEYDVPILSATQTNKDGANNTEVEMTNTSECIFVDEQITLRDGTSKIIGDINVGDQIISNDGFKTVMQVHHKKMKECVKITLKSGKTIIVSKDHVFPSNEGRKSVNDGLTVGTKLSSK
jgi:intein/homing endonuclease